jgi:hypothetical protein
MRGVAPRLGLGCSVGPAGGGAGPSGRGGREEEKTGVISEDRVLRLRDPRLTSLLLPARAKLGAWASAAATPGAMAPLALDAAAMLEADGPWAGS